MKCYIKNVFDYFILVFFRSRIINFCFRVIELVVGGCEFFMFFFMVIVEKGVVRVLGFRFRLWIYLEFGLNFR